MSIKIGVYILNESKLKNYIEKFADSYKNKNFIINYFYFDKEYNTTTDIDIVIFEEEESYLQSFETFNNIFQKYNKNIPFIIFSETRDIYNIVNWMRNGAMDYIWIGDCNENLIYNSIKGTLAFIKKKNNKDINSSPESTDNQLYYNSIINISLDNDWGSLKDNESYDMALIYLNIMIPKNDINKYSKQSIEKIYELCKNEISLMANNFGGKLWFWNNNYGVIIFHFEDYINSAVLMAINFINKFFLINIEKFNLEKLLNYKIGLHTGKGIYNKQDTNQITCDLINYLFHLSNQYIKENCFYISEETYNKISYRLINYFTEIGDFQNKKVYAYKELL